jgi:hypothetical protein
MGYTDRDVRMGAALVLVALSCGCDDREGDDALEGVTLQSEATVGMGLGPNGPVKGHATLSFSHGEYEWHHSDLVCSGSYRMSGADVNAETNIPCASDGPIRGHWDAPAGVLTWAQGARYVRR